MKHGLVILIVLVCTSAQARAGDRCHQYMDDRVMLTGKVALRTFYGPPNYGENPATDEREIQALLVMDKPICVAASGEEEAEGNQRELTLIPSGNTKLKDYVGKKITVQGRLFHAYSGHHHTPVLIQVTRFVSDGS